MDNKVFTKLSYGVYAVTTWDNGRPTGCIANSIMQITSNPATVAISINHNNYTNGCIDRNGKFAVSVLKEKTDPSIIGTLGFFSGRDINKFEKVSYELKDYMPVVTDACGYIVCNVINKMETETHTVFLGEVIAGEAMSEEDPMTYAYYHKVIKGKSPKNAPTYIPEEETEKRKKKFKCQVCGYVYEGEELPEDFICPVCGVGADKFTEIV